MQTLSDFIQPFFEWLLRSTLQASVVICLVLVIQIVLRKRLTVRWHYALWLILIVRMILPWAPQSRFSIYNLVARENKSNSSALVTPEAHSEPPEASEESPATQQALAEAKPADITEEQDNIQPAPGTRPRESAHSAMRTVFGWSYFLPLLWLGGALLLGGYIVFCNLRLWRAASVECPSTDKDTLELLEECRTAIGLRTIVALIPSEAVNTPILLGFVRPRLLVPKNISKKLTREELRYIFLHELAHVKRHDIALGWLTALLQVLHWFNPLVWLAFHRMRSNRESACDALVLSRTQGEGTHNYGLAIVSLLEHFSVQQPLPGLAGILESKSQLKRRIAMITQFRNNSYRWSPLAATLIVVVACVTLPDAPGTKASTTQADATPEPTLRRIEVKTRGNMSSPSFDGKYLLDGLLVREVASGRERKLTPPGPTGMAFMSSASPDNSKIVYYLFNPEKGDNDIRIVAFDGSNDRLLWPAEKIAGWFSIDTWSPDSKYLFGRHNRKEKGTRLVQVSVDDGSVQPIEAVDANGVAQFDISPDGRFLAYSRKDKTTAASDIFVFDLAENREAVLMNHSADDKLLGWTPDGGHILFTSDRLGTWDGWLLAVKQGKSHGLPELIRPEMGDLRPIRLTRDGSLYYAVEHDISNVYTVRLDQEAGEAGSDPSPVRDIGKDASPDWSADGRYLAYCSQPDRDKPQIIRIRTLATGQEKELKPDLPHCDWLRWCPDSRHILVTGPMWGHMSNVYKVDIQTGGYAALLDREVRNIRQAELSADGGTLVYRIRGGGNENHLIVKDLETGREKELLKLETFGWAALTFGNGWTLLPDGKQVALSIRDDSPDSPYMLKIMSIADGAVKTVVADSVGHVTWTSEGRDLLFVRQGKELWRVAVAGGSQPQKVWEWNRSIANPRMHPDGRNLAFAGRTRVSEMWLMENFLPTATVAAEQSRTSQATTLRKILPEEGDFANVSPDGKYLCDADPDTDNLAIRELATGKRWPVTGKKTWEESDEWAEDAAISPDSRRVAYISYHEGSDLPSLYVVNLDGSDCKLLCKDLYAIPRDWSADNSRILAVTYRPPHRMFWISASDGSIQPIKDIEKGFPGKFDVSPDGRFIAYDIPQTEGATKRDVFLLDLRDNSEIRLAEDPANDRLLGWTTDGKWILFASDRSDKWDAWLLGIKDGVPTGPPRMVKANIGDVGAAGFAANGDYYFSIYDLRSNVYVAPFDIAKGTLLSSPVHMQPTSKSCNQVWSPDGRHLAYACYTDDKTSLIKIRSIVSGQEREFKPKLPLSLFSWAPDGKSLVMSGFIDEGWYNAVYKLDLETGECSELLRHNGFSIAYAQWLPDGKRLLYHGHHHGSNPPRKKLGYLMIRDMDSGTEREIAGGEFWKDFQWGLSPDGRQLAVKLKGDNPCIKIFSTETDEARDILTGDLADKALQISWTPDGRTLMLRVLNVSAKRTSEIWRVAIDGREPEKLSDIVIPESVTDMRIDPTGRHIALGAHTNLHELWVMENFLPEEVGR